MDVGCPLQTRNGFCTFWGTFPERPCPQWCTCHFVAKSSAICNIEFSFPRNLISTISRCIPKRVKISTIRSSKVLLTKGTARYTCWVRPPRVVYVGRGLAVSCVPHWPGDGAVGGWAKNEYFPPLRRKPQLRKTNAGECPCGSESTHFLLAIYPRTLD